MAQTRSSSADLAKSQHRTSDDPPRGRSRATHRGLRNVPTVVRRPSGPLVRRHDLLGGVVLFKGGGRVELVRQHLDGRRGRRRRRRRRHRAAWAARRWRTWNDALCVYMVYFLTFLLANRLPARVVAPLYSIKSRARFAARATGGDGSQSALVRRWMVIFNACGRPCDCRTSFKSSRLTV